MENHITHPPKRYPMNPPAIAIVGYKNSGKTQVVETLTKELTDRGLKVATIKHTAENTPLDTPGKDTHRHKQAGATATAILHNKGAAIYHQQPMTIQQTAKQLDNPDIIILEGFKTINHIPRILVPRNQQDIPQLENGLEIAIARLENRQLTHTTPVIDITNPIELANIVQNKAIPLLPGHNCNTCGHQTCHQLAKALLDGIATITQCTGYSTKGVTLKVDDEKIPLNRFTEKIIRNKIRGILKSLKDLNPQGKIEVKIDD